jgi:cytoskeleton protein RodZ
MQSIGERLEEARKRKGISIREAAEATKIRSDYLHKFESNQFDIKLPEIYVRGFLRTYANYLKLPAEKIVSDYNALGLGNPPAQKSLNREVYGRMDLSVSSAKPEKEAKEPVAVEAPEQPPPTGTARNPATFVPRAGAGVQIDRGLVIKLGSIAAAVIIGVGLLLWWLLRDDTQIARPTAPNSTEAVWVRPQAGEPHIVGLVAREGRVQVTVTEVDTGTVLFQGAIPPGDRRDIPHRGKLQVTSDAPEFLRVAIGGREWPLQDNTGKYLKAADIRAP